MSLPIIAAIRTQHQLKESLLHTAQELAHKASFYGVARVSYGYLALKCHCSKRTVMRHIQRLIDLHLIAKRTIWIRGNYCEVNTYTFRLAWDRTSQRGSDKVAPKLPHPNTEEKSCSLAEQIRTAEKALRFCTEGTDAYATTLEHLERLRALQHP